MKNHGQKIAYLFLCFLLLTNCSSEEEAPVSRVTDETIREDFQAIPLSPGIKDISLEVAEGIYYNFRVIIPDVDLNERWPLVMAFHGASNGDPNAHKTTGCLIEPGFAGLDAFIIHPNADNFEWYEQENQHKIQTLLTLATTYWPINFGRILATGYSNGGNASWLMAEVASNVFTASIPMASSYDISVTENTSRKMNIPMYVIHGENDELFPIDVTKKWVDESIAAGSDITFVQADGLTHFKPCDYVSYLEDAVDWLKELWK
jgi:predicted peptidase